MARVIIDVSTVQCPTRPQEHPHLIEAVMLLPTDRDPVWMCVFCGTSWADLDTLANGPR